MTVARGLFSDAPDLVEQEQHACILVSRRIGLIAKTTPPQAGHCCARYAGAHDRVVAHAELRQVQPAAGAGARLRGLQGVLPGLALGAQAVLADQHGQCRCERCTLCPSLSGCSCSGVQMSLMPSCFTSEPRLFCHTFPLLSAEQAHWQPRCHARDCWLAWSKQCPQL